MLGQLTCEDFATEVGRWFLVEGDGQGHGLELVSATPSRRTAPAGARAGFSLLFRAPSSLGAAQGTYRIQHPRLGALDLFLVPVGASAQSIEFEAVFN